MCDFSFDVLNDSGEIIFRLYPFITKKEIVVTAKNILKNAWPVKFFTATTDLKDFIGNVVKINSNNTCSVKGVYRGKMLTLKNIRIGESGIIKDKRVMVSEHLNVDGKMELIATLKRILLGGMNFINIGWSNKTESHITRIDIYTGETKLIYGGPNVSKIKC